MEDIDIVIIAGGKGSTLRSLNLIHPKLIRYLMVNYFENRIVPIDFHDKDDSGN